MKILYATYRYDPTNPDSGSSVDYQRHQALLQAGFEVCVAGPITDKVTILERIELSAWRLYKKWTGKSGIKFPLSLAWRASRTLQAIEKEWKPDVIFSIFPSFFVFHSPQSPTIWELDTTFLGQEEFFPQYGSLPLSISVWEEKKALTRAARIITMSEWSKKTLINQYKISGEKIEIIPMPSALPEEIIPSALEKKELSSPLKLLLVGRVYQRKGIDIAIETARQLNTQGHPTQLTICGMDAPTDEYPSFIRFVGNYKKSDPAQLKEYASWYEWAHLLIHPARFEAAGIVPSEAAAFGTPTITNNVGGLATTVKHGESGIVLPRSSPPEAYVQAIRELIADTEKYYALCKSTRQRYERELNSKAAGNRFTEILQSVII